MKIAFVYDRVTKFGGAERVLLALHEVWPEAPLYTAFYHKKNASWADDFEVIPSFLNKFPFSSANHEFFPLLTPIAFESFNFDKYDVVLSITSSDAKGIVTKPNTLHLSYILTPTRYLWHDYVNHFQNPGFGHMNSLARIVMKLFSPGLRQWDYIASKRPDKYIAISETVKQRIRKYYRQEANVIYPPVDIDKFRPNSPSSGMSHAVILSKNNEEYFLIVSRLVPYKNIDIAIHAFNKLGLSLKIIGSGKDSERLKKLAHRNIEFIGDSLTDEKLCWYYQNCRGFITPGEEDFGISAVEAQACGKPVIGLNHGGIKELIIPGVTGELYSGSAKSLIRMLKSFMKRKYKLSDCRDNSLKYEKRRFQSQIKHVVRSCWKTYR